MSKVYAAPKEIKDPSFQPSSSFEDYEKDCLRFISEVKAFCKKQSICPHAGEIISFPVADGSAKYMILDYRRIIHLPVDDAWEIPAAHARGLLKADIVQMIEFKEKMTALRNK